MATLVQDLSQMGQFDWSLCANITGNATGSAVQIGNTATNGFTMIGRIDGGQSITSLTIYPQTSADNVTWNNVTWANGTTANITFTSTNANSAAFFFPNNGTQANYVRANAILTGTSANMAVCFISTKRYDGSAGFANTPPSAST